MKNIITAFMAMFLVGCSEMTTKDIVDNVKSGIVLISNEDKDGKGGIGSGFIVGENTIVTNHHVVELPGKIYVYSDESHTKYEAEIAFQDVVADLAVLRIKDWNKFLTEETPTYVELGNSDDTEQGEKVIVIGHPWGLTWTIAEGIMSSKSRRMGSNPKFLDQVDAKLFQGNSGGPVFNENGQVVCVSNMMMTREGGSYGFCIPSNLVKKVLHDFNNLGEVRWRAINVEVGLTEDGSSVILKNVEPNGAAGKAGLKDGDKVLEIYTPNNHPKGVKPKDANDLITEMAQLRGDDELIKLLIERNGEKIMFDVKTNYRLSKEYTPDKGE